MNYYVRTQQALAANARLSAARMAYMHGLRGLGQSTAGVPAGSRLQYNVSWGSAQTGPGWNNPKGIIATITPALNNNWGIRVTAESDDAGVGIINLAGKVNVSLTVVTSTDYARQEDVQANIDHELYNVGLTPMSQIFVIQPGSTSPGTPPQPPATDFSSWISDNWPWVLAAGLGLVVVSEVL